PAEIVDKIYRHEFGLERPNNQQIRADFRDLEPPVDPPHVTSSTPGAVSMLPPVPATSKLPAHRVNSREGLEEVMVRGTLCLVEREAQLLADRQDGLARSAGMTWDAIEQLSRPDQEAAMRQRAPVIWAVLSTIVLSRAATTTAGQGHGSGAGAGQRIRNTIPALMIILFMLVSIRNPLVNYFQALMAVFMFSCNANKLLYLVTSRIGLSTSHSTLRSNLDRLGQSATAELQARARRAYESACDFAQQPQEYFLIVFDNVNKYYQAWNQTVAKKNRMKNGTAATAIMLEDVPEEKINAQARQSMTVQQLLDDVDPEHLQAVGVGMVMRTLISYIPNLSALRTEVEERFRSMDGYAKHRLNLRKTVTMPMGTSAIDENTTSGVSEILHDLVSTQMGMQPSWFKKILIMICGDQLTIDRLRKIIRYRATEDDIYESRSWALPIIQLWHMKLANLRAILKTHWFNKIGSDLFGLRQSVHALGRPINAEKCDFYPCHNAVKVVFEGLVLTATYVTLREETSETSESTNHMLDDLNALFASGGPFQECKLDQLDAIANLVYSRYMTTEAYNNTQTGPSDASSIMNLKDLFLDELQHYNQNTDYKADPEENLAADQLLGNITLFMRDAFWYLEFASAIPEGDIGRVFEIIKASRLVLLRFSFWGAGSGNYGRELLELAAGFLYEYSEPLKLAILNNYLVNPSGLPGRWQECDFFQEHSNKTIKTVFNSKNSEWDSRFLRDSVSVNIGGLSRLRESMLRFLGLGQVGQGQSHPDLSADINVLASHYLRGQVFKLTHGRRQVCRADDLVNEGFNKLKGGVFNNFLEQSASNRVAQSGADAAVTDDLEEQEDIEIPPEPLIMENGVLAAGAPNEPEDE
ncbi:hypothetical protein FRC07_005951, partial [Ceratobasidium sp. 392]